MLICGLQKLTLLDFPGYIACTIFTQGCNMRCPFCQNAGLVMPDEFKNNTYISTTEILSFLDSRKNKLQGICITGGEPTLQSDIIDFMGTVKAIGYKIKLDTNGTKPDIISKILSKKLINYIAMDIKNDQAHYAINSGSEIAFSNILQSIDLIKNANIEYEFRTTVVDELHSPDMFQNITDMLGHVKNYSLQYYAESENVINPIYHAPSQETMQTYAKILMQCAENVTIKGR